MTETHLKDDDLVLHYYGEMDRAAQAQAETHLTECGACRDGFRRLQRILETVESVPEPVLPDGFERTVWARLEPALVPERRGWLTWFVLSPGRLAWAATVVALVGVAFLAGRVSQRNTVPGPATAADVRERILMVDLTEHLDRSQMMLVDLVSGSGDGPVDMSIERARAGELVAANRLYRQTATATGDAAVSELLDDLERILVELAASPDTLSARDIEGVRQRIEAKGLLFKVRVLSSSVRERQKQQIRTRAGQRS